MSREWEWRVKERWEGDWEGSGQEESLKITVRGIGFSPQKGSVQDSVSWFYNRQSFSQLGDKHTHTHTQTHTHTHTRTHSKGPNITVIINKSDKAIHIPEEHTRRPPIEGSYSSTHKHTTHTHTHTCTGCVEPDGSEEWVRGADVTRSDSPSCVWEREAESSSSSSGESSRCSPPHPKCDLQSGNRSLYSHNEVSVDQKQIWGRVTSHGPGSLPLFIHHPQSKLNPTSYSSFKVMSPWQHPPRSTHTLRHLNLPYTSPLSLVTVK